MAASTKLRWKRCVNELRFISDELTIVQEIATAAGPEFQQYYEDFCLRKDIDLDNLNHTHGQKLQEIYEQKSPTAGEQYSQLDPEAAGALIPHSLFPSKQVNRAHDSQHSDVESGYQMTKDDLEMHETFSKVFKKLALVLHPDKLAADMPIREAQEKTEMFTDCTKALEERRYFVLIDLAEKFKVSFPRNYRQQIRWMNKETKRITEETRQHQKTYNYIFADAETEEEKDKVIHQFMTQVFGSEIFDQ